MDSGKKLLVLPVIFVALHLNYWMWDETRLVAGLPVNLLYHLTLSLLLSGVMLVVVVKCWPRYLDED